MLGSERMYVDAVLGLSMTATSVGLVLVEGQGADGATMERDAVDVRRGMRSADEAVAVVHRMEAAADDRGVRLHSIGVTWSDDADDQASTLLRSLAQSGFLNVVPIRMPEAAEALARGIADVIGRRTTAVCVIEPDAVFVLIVHSGALGSVRTAMNRAIATEQRLISWLSSIFARAEWTPEALVVVGSAGGFDDLLPLLEDALEVPVFSPDEAELALARGAALVSTSRVEVDTEFGSQGFAVPDRGTSRPAQGRDVWSSSQLGAASLLVAGVVTFVGSVSVAVSLALTPVEQVNAVKPVRAVEPAAVRPPPPAAPVAVAPPAAPVLPPAAPQPEAPLPEAPPVDAALAPVEPGSEQPAADPGIVETPPVEPAPPVVVPPPEPEAPKPLRTRILDRLRRVNDPEPPPVEPAPPPAELPPPVP